MVLRKTLLLHDLQSEIEVADFDRLLAKIEHVPIEHQEMRTLLIKVLSHIIRRLLTSKKLILKYKSILEMWNNDLLAFYSSKNLDNQILKMWTKEKVDDKFLLAKRQDLNFCDFFIINLRIHITHVWHVFISPTDFLITHFDL